MEIRSLTRHLPLVGLVAVGLLPIAFCAAIFLPPILPDLSWLLVDSSGVWVLVADAIALAYVLSPRRGLSRLFWATFAILTTFNLILLTGDDWWKTVKGGVRGPHGVNVPPSVMDELGVVVPWALLFFVAAPFLRPLIHKKIYGHTGEFQEPVLSENSAEQSQR